MKSRNRLNVPRPSPNEASYAIYSNIPDSDPLHGIVVPFFVSRIKDHANHLQECLANRKFGELKVKAHHLKGAGGGFGFPIVSQIAAEIESATAELCPDIENLRKLVDSFTSVSTRIACGAISASITSKTSIDVRQ
jgi:HPt (histidine-containing phosphotransfer) domain-containing protein